MADFEIWSYKLQRSIHVINYRQKNNTNRMQIEVHEEECRWKISNTVNA